MAKNQYYQGYPFPNVPKGWSEDGKRFAQGLRYLFDQLFARKQVSMDDVYPVGVVVLTGDEESPFSFGEWTAVTTGITGVYGWKRTG